MDELKPCTFCGGEARPILYHNKECTWVRHYVQCRRCDAKTSKYMNREGVWRCIDEAPTVDAVELPKGKPGDYLEWDNGAGFKQVYCIGAVMICEDCMRYELADFTPVVNHPNIVRTMSREEAEKELRDRWAREIVKEEPNLTACSAKMDGDGNG